MSDVTFDRVVHLVIMLADGESLLLMNLVNHSMEMCLAQLYKKLRFVTTEVAIQVAFRDKCS